MATLFKDTCSRCGETARYTESFLTRNKKDCKVLCPDCMAQMSVHGFKDYRNMICETAYYEDVLQYEKMNAEIRAHANNYPALVVSEEFDKDYDKGMYKTHSTIIGSIKINPDYIQHLDYPGLLIKSSDVIAATLEKSYEFKYINVETVKLSIFTKNPLIPYLSTFYSYKIKLTSTSRKQKTITANVIDVINGCCTGLRYKVSNPSKVLRKVKWDFSYNIPEVKKRKLCSWLSDDKYHAGYFKTNKILKQSK